MKYIYYEGLVIMDDYDYVIMDYMIMETEKSHDLRAGGPGKLVAQFQFKPKGLQASRANGVSPSPSPKAWEPGVLRSKGRKIGRAQLSIHYSSGFLFFSAPQQVEW